MSSLFTLARPLIFAMDPERAHRATIAALKTGMLPRRDVRDSRLEMTVAGLRVPNPLGMAAGFDKDAEVPGPLLKLGFGFVEVGTLTPLPQSGNPKPRIFRLEADRGVINRLGFNNGGIDQAIKRLRRRAFRHGTGRIGINVGANKDSEDRIGDYVTGVTKAAPVADYLTVNISSPNTPGLRALQSKDALAELLSRTLDARGGRDLPMFVKVAPDLTDADVADIAEVAAASGINGIIVSNTTIDRPASLRSDRADEIGGLSGQPLIALALRRLKDFRQALGPDMPLIGVGGISNADDAYARIRAGASLIQLYSAMVYEGPGLPRRILKGLVSHLNADGIARISDAVGADAPR
ncbi:quinone-dependent dihydroorotate dehydrogenase [Pacificimonas sp. WHA3]|uniref:Dihydroorotate dehydrogenase (quinone) n=1 Tax=Pacificimonas pallii TaxID=2827236 RepID=A0ABS6SI41_9SPHN|nr:quinone-dependent dihydroorotate dehydrogenase [Pacificimonas pallii]MBV7257537.1 quinone-dependent dihydroorotate dehydrogenase [Pacificimonas pallii]